MGKQRRNGPRRQYETAEHLQKEFEVATTLANKWSLTLCKLPISYHADFIAFDRYKDVKAVIEIKNRNVLLLKAQIVILSLLKWHSCIALATTMKTKFVLVIKSMDGIFFYTYSPDHDKEIKFDFGGRVHTQRDSADIEPIVNIPAKLFEQL